MTVHVKLKTERRPCRDTKIAKAKFPVDKIEIVMKTLALVKLQEGLPSCFIMPGPVGITAFHSRKDMDQTFRFSGFGNDVLDAVISICPHSARRVNPVMLSAVGLALKKVCSDRKENELFL